MTAADVMADSPQLAEADVREALQFAAAADELPVKWLGDAAELLARWSGYPIPPNLGVRR